MLDCLKNMKLVAPQTVFGGNWKPCIRNQEPPKHARKIKSYPFQLPRATPMSSKHCSTWLLLLKHRKTIEKPLLKDAEKLPHLTTAIIFAPPPHPPPETKKRRGPPSGFSRLCSRLLGHHSGLEHVPLSLSLEGLLVAEEQRSAEAWRSMGRTGGPYRGSKYLRFEGG